MLLQLLRLISRKARAARVQGRFNRNLEASAAVQTAFVCLLNCAKGSARAISALTPNQQVNVNKCYSIVSNPTACKSW